MRHRRLAGTAFAVRRRALFAVAVAPSIVAFVGCGGDGKAWVKSLPGENDPVQQPAGWTNEPTQEAPENFTHSR